MRGRFVLGATAWAVILGTGVVLVPAGVANPALPPPSFAHTINIGLVSGTVIVTLPSGQSFTLGPQDRHIPIQSLIDTSHGRVDLRAAPAPASGTASVTASRVEDAQFYGGDLRVSQASADSATQIRLAGGRFAACAGASGLSTCDMSFRWPPGTRSVIAASRIARPRPAR